MTKAGLLRSCVALVIFAVIVLQSLSHSTAQSAGIQLAVDTANTNQDGLFVIYGGLALQGDIGLPVGAGDVNGDGRADILYGGMYGSTAPFTNNGTVNVYLSDGRDTGFIDQATHPSNIFRILGRNSGDLLGTSSSVNGDVNGDGKRDILTCAALQDGPNLDRFNAGAAYVVLGANNLSGDINLSTGSATPPPGVIAIYGPQINGRMGIWCDEGDVDGDGFDDIIIGSDQINSGDDQHVGGAYIVFGQPNLPQVIDLASPPAGVRTARILGAHKEDHWGAALQVADINGDGIDDIIIGGSIDRDSGSYISVQDQVNGHNFFGASFNGTRDRCGEVFVIYGQHNWPADTHLAAPPANATHVIGAVPFDLLGSQAYFGDINGDGRTDLILGALQAQSPNLADGRTGAVYVAYGSPTLEGATIDLANPGASGERVTAIYGVHNGDCTGDSVRCYDINNDGMAELFIGSPERNNPINGEQREDAGVNEIIFGQHDFLPSVIELSNPPASPPVYQLAGAKGEDQASDHDGDEFSYRLIGGDVDGDGFTDVIINAMHGNGFNDAIPNAGNVYVFSGKKLSQKLGRLTTTQPSPTPQLSGATLKLNGQTVQQAGAGQGGLSITISGTNLRDDTAITINGTVVVSHFQAGPPATITVNLDENPTIKNSVGSLVVSARNTTPPASNASNQVTAGTLTGPQITLLKVKKKAAGALVLKITGNNFPSDGTLDVTANGQTVPLKFANFESSIFISAKIGAGTVPSGTVIHVTVRTAAGIASNEATVTAP